MNTQSPNDWSIIGPIIERERISLSPSINGALWWVAPFTEQPIEVESPEYLLVASAGATPLEAVMKALESPRKYVRRDEATCLHEWSVTATLAECSKCGATRSPA